jgi:hypothetical protein
MVGCPRPNRWLVEPDSTAGFTQRALVRMKKERAKTFISKDKNGLSVARSLYVSLDRADNVIEGGPPLRLCFHLTKLHGWIISLHHIVVPRLLFRVAAPFDLKGAGFCRPMANRLIRRHGQGHLHFITFTCFRRLPLLRSVRASWSIILATGSGAAFLFTRVSSKD